MMMARCALLGLLAALLPTSATTAPDTSPVNGSRIIRVAWIVRRCPHPTPPLSPARPC